ncbi:MAG: glycosyltransferase [Deltaproteobacteria bacterium]
MPNPLVSVVIPARNEESNIAKCLSSVVAQTYGNIEIIIVDDNSEDGTAEQARVIQKTCGKINLIQNSEIKPGWTGKNYVLSLGVAKATGQWLLFLDADTELYPRAVEETLAFCLSNKISMRSLSPEQTLVGFWERAIQPVIFDILAALYDYGRVNDPAEKDAAANGQFIFIERDTYEKVGGHASVRGKMLEDLELAKCLKREGFAISFGYGGGAVKCRMYKSLGEIIEGWTKGLFTLAGLNFKNAARIIASLIFALLPVMLCVYFSALSLRLPSPVNFTLLGASVLWGAAAHFRRRRRFRELNYPPSSAILHPIGAVFAIFLIVRSAYPSATSGKVRWKGREYPADKN